MTSSPAHHIEYPDVLTTHDAILRMIGYRNEQINKWIAGLIELKDINPDKHVIVPAPKPIYPNGMYHEQYWLVPKEYVHVGDHDRPVVGDGSEREFHLILSHCYNVIIPYPIKREAVEPPKPRLELGREIALPGSLGFNQTHKALKRMGASRRTTGYVAPSAKSKRHPAFGGTISL